MRHYCRFDIDGVDVVRHILPDVVVLITSLLSFLLIILLSLTQTGERPSVDKESKESTGSDKHKKRDSNLAMGNYDSEFGLQGDSSKRLSKSSIRSRKLLEKGQRPSFLLMPSKQSFSYLTTAWNFTVVFLLWLSGVCVASTLNFPYFVASVYLSLGWALQLNHTGYFVISRRIITVIVALYSAVHLIALYLYQFQSAQDLVPRPSISARYEFMYVRHMYNKTHTLCICTCVHMHIYIQT